MYQTDIDKLKWESIINYTISNPEAPIQYKGF